MAVFSMLVVAVAVGVLSVLVARAGLALTLALAGGSPRRRT